VSDAGMGERGKEGCEFWGQGCTGLGEEGGGKQGPFNVILLVATGRGMMPQGPWVALRGRGGVGMGGGGRKQGGY